ncbi:MAG: lysine--tRNA ligase [Patescibacteria group bacterium]
MTHQPKPEAEVRLEKLEELKKLGIDPYPAAVPAYITIEEARTKKDGAKLATLGRITGMRGHGGSAFLDIEDEGHKLQLFFKKDEVGKEYDLLKLFDHGDYLWVEGEMFTTKAGELSLKVKKFQLLAKSLLPVPDGWNGLSDVETRYRQRTLDFKTNDQAKKIIVTRAKVVEATREFFVRHGFLEVHTPILQPIPGGAAAKPFITHHNALEADFYLRIAPELYLKRLVAGGFNRVFEIGPNFRNEGLSHMHNPEFYTAEAYWAYQDYRGFMQATQELVQELVKKVCGSLKITYQNQKLDFSGDFAVKKYADIIKDDTGIDIAKADDFDALNAAVKKAGIKFDNQNIKVWNELVDELFKKVSRPKIVQPTFVIDYPLVTTPLAKRHRDNPELAERFQLIAAGGFELVNAYTELNDPVDQEGRFREQMKMKQAGWEEAQLLDENFVEALKFGLPPTAGWGMGIERLVMVLTDQHSIKEVIPFPTLRPLDKPKK